MGEGITAPQMTTIMPLLAALDPLGKYLCYWAKRRKKVLIMTLHHKILAGWEMSLDGKAITDGKRLRCRSGCGR